MGKGTFKHICEDCQAENWLTKKERDSASRPRCTNCGSTWLEPSNASKQILNASDASHERAKLTKKKMGKE